MNKKLGKIATTLFVVMSIICISLSVYAHSGRKDSSGGHKDNKNKSGLGSYHYHCGGYPAHLHKNGICPYSSTNKTTTSSNKNNTGSKNTSIKATKIKIIEQINSIYVGESEKITATISPSNVTDKKITWKSSDKNIATVSPTGKITAIKEGKVTITASTSNGKASSIEIEVVKKEEIKTKDIIENNIVKENIIQNDTIKNNINENNVIEVSATTSLNKADGINSISNANETEEDRTAGAIITLGALGGGYWLYRKRKK